MYMGLLHGIPYTGKSMQHSNFICTFTLDRRAFVTTFAQAMNFQYVFKINNAANCDPHVFQNVKGEHTGNMLKTNYFRQELALEL